MPQYAAAIFWLSAAGQYGALSDCVIIDHASRNHQHELVNPNGDIVLYPDLLVLWMDTAAARVVLDTLGRIGSKQAFCCG
jgi:hypothetical protein